MNAPATTTLVERPPPGPARGALPAPAWLVVLMSAGLAAAAVYALWRALRGGRRRHEK